ncbi:ureidoglycolate hydrolase [Bordetella pertussis 18323]|uniref:Ureidoglycolate hydrolase n=2 Tax=Bordetella pertussis TaxID=520 RepID=A0A0T7CRS8_BORP1|nr:ureidoglycolate hydrolase [Bordetella pertussis 18323]CCJ64348.1 conserved hypothetical protein [Bordetella pertussis 18323]
MRLYWRMPTTTPALRPQDLTETAFAPYGWMLGKPLPAGDDVPRFSNPATDFWQEHVFDTGAGAGRETEVLWVNYRISQPGFDTLEKHLLTQQAIVPLTGAIVQIVARSAFDGSPDLASLAAFVVPPGQGICMRPGCWHATRISGGEVTCLMLTRRSTTLDLVRHLHGEPARESEIVAIVPHGLDLPARPTAEGPAPHGR